MMSIEQATERVAAQLQKQLEPLLATALSNPLEPALLPEIEDVAPDGATLDVRQTISISVGNAEWFVELVASTDPGTDEWLRVGATSSMSADGGPPRFEVQLNLALEHPFSRRFLGPSNEGSELLLSAATAIGLALAISRNEGAKAYTVLQHLNELTRKTLSAFAGARSAN